ncbi:2840_t:CDS:2, partial [Diversispora eburnea]
DIEQRFRLTNIRELATDCTPLLSFMFYTGALIYKPGSLKYELQIPNHIAKKEFIQRHLRFMTGRKKKVLLEPLKDNSVVYSNEETLKQTFMTAFILTYRTDIEPEFKVSNFDKKAIDLVKTSTKKRIAIEFEKLEDEILDLKTLDYKFSNRNKLQEDSMEISPQMTEAGPLQNKDASSSAKNAIEPTSEICSKCFEAISPELSKPVVLLTCKYVIHFECIGNKHNLCPKCPSADDLEKEGYYISPGISINEVPKKKRKKPEDNT